MTVAKMESLKGKPNGNPSGNARIEHHIADGEETDPALLEEVGRTQQQLNSLYLHEPWFEAFIEGCGEPFITYWREASSDVPEQDSREQLSLPSPKDVDLEPVPFNVPGIPEPLSFVFHQERVARDTRFRILYLWPTHREAGEWVAAQQAE